MAKPLVIVESPAKAKTIAGFLGPGYLVESSIGHIRDLPRSAADVPSSYKGEPWARLGVDVDNGFKPLYVVSSGKRDQVAKLKKLVKEASEVYLATDEDREGESIAWHLLEVLSPRVPVKRMVFHEITKGAIERALAEWRDLDRHLVDAQEARRILDRLYGYEVSPVLWKKVMPRLSAGRVQSVAVRMVVERERARMGFSSARWWDLVAVLQTSGGGTPRGATGARQAGGIDSEERPAQSFEASLIEIDGKRLATGKDFDDKGLLQAGGKGAPEGLPIVLDEARARGLAASLQGRPFHVASVTERPWRRSPAAPFMTSTLQQEAARKLHFSAQRTMQAAQRLYEQGYITYMRTDSTNLAEVAVSAARREIARRFGDRYLPERPRLYLRKVKNAQEAHEAIRPAGEHFLDPGEVARAGVGGDPARLYELIWQRTIACQMADAEGQTAQVRIRAESADGRDSLWGASGRVITFPGFLRVYEEGRDDADSDSASENGSGGDAAGGASEEHALPPLVEGDSLVAREIEARDHATQPPARFTEASLVKALEEQGVGRPSTYASILATIQDRGYVWKKGSALVPTFTAFAVVGLLERYFSELVDYHFTAGMEDDLDQIASGSEEAIPWLERFYFGDIRSGVARGNGIQPADGGVDGERRMGLKEAVATHLGEIDARSINSIVIGEDFEGVPIVVRVGRYGPYVQRGDERASVPEDLPPDELTAERALALLSAPSGDRVLGSDPVTGMEVSVRTGRYGPYVQLGDAESDPSGKPRRASLFTGMEAGSLGLEEALQLLSLPRVVGVDPADGQEVVAANGRFGPYLKKGAETRSLTSERELLSIDLEGALAVLAQPKTRRGRPAKPPLRELGADPVSGGVMVVKDGRFGPYVTDGVTNASLRAGDTVESLTAERAAELLADRRAAGPSVKRATKKAGTAKRATKKAGAAKSAAKKAGTAKKAGAAKSAAKKAGTAKSPAMKAGASAITVGREEIAGSAAAEAGDGLSRDTHGDSLGST